MEPEIFEFFFDWLLIYASAGAEDHELIRLGISEMGQRPSNKHVIVLSSHAAHRVNVVELKYVYRETNERLGIMASLL